MTAPIGGRCGFQTAPTATIDLGNLENGFSREVPFVLGCNLPMRLAVISQNGGLRAPVNPQPGTSNLLSQRSCAGPEETTQRCADYSLESRGPGLITEQLLDNPLTVIFGGGAATFEQRAKAGEWKNRTLLDQVRDRSFTIVKNTDALNSLPPGTTRSGSVLGLFANGNMPVHWTGPKATLRGNLDLPPVTCKSNPARTGDIPNLAQMTAKAIELLSGSPKGFFLQVEGASIDKQAHAAKSMRADRGNR